MNRRRQQSNDAWRFSVGRAVATSALGANLAAGEIGEKWLSVTRLKQPHLFRAGKSDEIALRQLH